MPLSGYDVRSVKISTDATTDNLQELRADSVGVISWNPGRRVIDRTRAGDVTARDIRIKPRPLLVLSFDPDVSPNQSAGVILFPPGLDGPRAFEIEFIDPTASVGAQGIKVTGVALLSDEGLDQNVDTRVATMTVRLNPVGTAWEVSNRVD